jgi:hypothetical protein
VFCEVFVLLFGILNCGFEEYLVQTVDLGFGDWLTTMGYVGWINTFQGQQNDPRSGTEESELVRALRNLGAVLYT